MALKQPGREAATMTIANTSAVKSSQPSIGLLNSFRSNASSTVMNAATSNPRKPMTAIQWAQGFSRRLAAREPIDTL